MKVKINFQGTEYKFKFSKSQVSSLKRANEDKDKHKKYNQSTIITLVDKGLAVFVPESKIIKLTPLGVAVTMQMNEGATL